MNVPFLLSPKVSIAYIDYNLTVRQALEIFRAHGYTAVPVLTSNGFYKGTVSEGDFLRCILRYEVYSMRELEDIYIKDILREDSDNSVNIDATIEEVTERLMNSNFVSVVDGRGCFIGIITRKSLIAYQRKILERYDYDGWDGK